MWLGLVTRVPHSIFDSVEQFRVIEWVLEQLAAFLSVGFLQQSSKISSEETLKTEGNPHRHFRERCCAQRQKKSNSESRSYRICTVTVNNSQRYRDLCVFNNTTLVVVFATHTGRTEFRLAVADEVGSVGPKLVDESAAVRRKVAHRRAVQMEPVAVEVLDQDCCNCTELEERYTVDTRCTVPTVEYIIQ